MDDSKTQEVWITLRIKSELPITVDAEAFAKRFASGLSNGKRIVWLSHEYASYLRDARAVELLEVEQEAEIYETECGDVVAVLTERRET